MYTTPRSRDLDPDLDPDPHLGPDPTSGVASSATHAPLPSSVLPDIARGDARLAVAARRTVRTPARQHAVADAVLAIWRREPWPAALLSVSCFTSSDGETVLTYTQWASEDGYRAFTASSHAILTTGLDAFAHDVTRTDVVAYRLYRSGVPEATRHVVPGCFVFVSVQFDGPDERRQRQWVDTVFDALASEPEPPAGGLAGHFHLSVDGTRVLNYAEWIDEDAHRRALERSGQGAIGSSPKWREVRQFPGIVVAGFTRYRFHQGLAAPGHINAA